MSDGQVFNLSNPTFMSSLFSAEKAVHEEPIQIMWNTIVLTFPPLGPRTFKLAIKSPSLDINTEPVAIVIKVRFAGTTTRSSPQLQECQIFMVECKSWEHDTPGGWELALSQLDKNLHANENGSDKMFGAVVIGTKTIVYQWERNAAGDSSLQPIHAGTIDLKSQTDRIGLESALDRVKSQGWRDVMTSM